MPSFGAANEALADLREGRLQGAAVLVPSFVEAQEHSWSRLTVAGAMP